MMVNAMIDVGLQLVVHAIAQNGTSVLVGSVMGNSVRAPVVWQNGRTLAPADVGGLGVSFRFYLVQGVRLYSFVLTCVKAHTLPG